MPLLILTASAAGATGALALCVAKGPQCIAGFVSRIARHMLEDEQLRLSVKKMAKEVEFSEWGSEVIAVGAVDGMQRMVKDEQFANEMKALIIRELHSQAVQQEISKATVAIVKNGVRDALSDNELKDIFLAAITDASRDDRLLSIVRSSLKDALQDRELHEATLSGAMEAVKEQLTPFRFNNPLRLNSMDSTPEQDGERAFASSGALSPEAPREALLKFVETLKSALSATSASAGSDAASSNGGGLNGDGPDGARRAPSQGHMLNEALRSCKEDSRVRDWGRHGEYYRCPESI
eukprot:TRINITY_DN34896_c0_g1_i1.p1 TRINITY_DN34896_c0_g1~~TRINITY_DN34896_c0_g1_i1.p1  ORF type:complete len:294 (+),score=83.54 TRINITY_DN34896_c0_g1_i1:91-972(+)